MQKLEGTEDVQHSLICACKDGWVTRAKIFRTSRRWRANEQTYRLLCKLLSSECLVYVPLHEDGPNCWRRRFEIGWALRDRWAVRPLSEEEKQAAKTCTTVAEFMKRSKAGESDLDLQHGWSQRKNPPTFYSYIQYVILHYKVPFIHLS